MEIVFGWYCDGPTFPETVTGQTAAFNSFVCGPSGLLDLLATHFGIGLESIGTAMRIAGCMLALEQFDDSQQFFSRSFAVDPWSTARHLLAMRDELTHAGWTGQELAEIPKTKTFAALEKFSSQIPGNGDLARRILGSLKKSNQNPISKLTLISDPVNLPSIWKAILEALKDSGTVIELSKVQPKATKGDLLKIQQALCLPPKGKLDLDGDGSFTILDADDEIQAAEMAASWLAAGLESTALVCGDHNLMLDQACVRQGLPRPGLSANSVHREILQVLPLSIELAWTPFNPSRCLEFLSIGEGPLPRFVCRALKKALHEQPGLNGPLWIEAWNSVSELRKKYLSESISHEVTVAQLDVTVSNDLLAWQKWFEGLADRRIGMSSSIIQGICKRIESWATGAAVNSARSDLYFLAASHARELSEIVTSFGDRFFPIHQLNSIVETVLKDGLARIESSAEASPFVTLKRPGQIWNSISSVLWWEFSSPHQATFPRDFWTPDEIELFSKAEIEIDSSASKALREAESWHYPILNAQDEVLLIKPRSIGGEIAVVHPIWDELKALISRSSRLKLTLHASEILSSSVNAVANRQLVLSTLESIELPRPLYEWHINSELISLREKESYTSTAQLIGCPLAWTLEYTAKVHANWLQPLSEGEKLIGEFAHSVISRMFAEKTNWQPMEARERSLKLIDELSPQLASSLLLPGSAVALRKAKETIASSIEHLVKLLNQAGLSVVGTEIDVEASFYTGKFTGSIDLLVETKDKQPVVLDLKWTQYPNTYRQKFADGNALQLASYSWLISEQPGSKGFSPVGFFLLRQASLLANDGSIFPNDVVESLRGMQEIWQLTHHEYGQAIESTTSGTVCATGLMEATQAGENSLPRLIEPPCKICSFGHFCGVKELK